MHSIPTLLVTGADRSAKTTFLRALLAIRPPRERWALLDNDDNPGSEDAVARDLFIASARGCACCTGRISLQTGVVRLLREAQPQRLVIVAAAAAEPDALLQALQQEHLAAALRMVRNQCIVATSLQSAGESAYALWLRQMRAADDVVAIDDAAAEALDSLSMRVIGITEATSLALAGLAKAACS